MSQIEVSILQQDYVLTCPEGQEPLLAAAARRVDEDMERIRHTGKVRSRERVCVLVAVNLAFENAALHSRLQTLEQAPEPVLTQESAAPAEALTLPASAVPASAETTPCVAPEEVDEVEAFAAMPTAFSAEAGAIDTPTLESMQALLALREQELQRMQLLIDRLEAALIG